MESTELLGMFQQCWVGVKSASFDCILVFPCRHSNGEREPPHVMSTSTLPMLGCVKSTPVNCATQRSALHFPLSPLSPLYLRPIFFIYSKNFLSSPPSPSFSRVRVVESKLISRFASLSHSPLLLRTRNRHHRWTKLSQQHFPTVDKNKIFSFKTVVSRDGEESRDLANAEEDS